MAKDREIDVFGVSPNLSLLSTLGNWTPLCALHARVCGYQTPSRPLHGGIVVNCVAHDFFISFFFFSKSVFSPPVSLLVLLTITAKGQRLDVQLGLFCSCFHTRPRRHALYRGLCLVARMPPVVGSSLILGLLHQSWSWQRGNLLCHVQVTKSKQKQPFIIRNWLEELGSLLRECSLIILSPIRPLSVASKNRAAERLKAQYDTINAAFFFCSPFISFRVVFPQ